MAHIDAGKTTLTERILYYTGRSPDWEVHDGAATMDWMEQERERESRSPPPRRPVSGTTTRSTSSIRQATWTSRSRWNVRSASSTAPSPCSAAWRSRAAVRNRWRQADKYGVPRIAFVNKLDRVGADFNFVVNMMRDRWVLCGAASDSDFGCHHRGDSILQSRGNYVEARISRDLENEVRGSAPHSRDRGFRRRARASTRTRSQSSDPSDIVTSKSNLKRHARAPGGLSSCSRRN